jgi:dihydrofolate reductase
MGKIVCHFTMSLDGFVAGRRGWDEAISAHRPYGGKWSGPVFVLTHHPADGRPAESVSYVDDLPSALEQARAAAGDKNVEIFSPGIGRQALELGLLDEFDLHLAPVLLGDGVRLYDAPSGAVVPLRHADASRSVVDLRFEPAP